MATTQPVRQARGSAREQAIALAVMGVIAERGVAGCTHRAVAAASGVPVGSVSYYFPTVDTLLEGALRHFVEGEVARLRVVERELEQRGATPGEYVDALMGAVGTGPLPQFELYLEAARRPALRAAAAQCLDAYAGVAEAALRASGSPRAAMGARLFVALADGLALHALAAPEPSAVLATRLHDGMLSLWQAFAPAPAPGP
jgi:DNA-binding transcriptional regulator YbjK